MSEKCIPRAAGVLKPGDCALTAWTVEFTGAGLNQTTHEVKLNACGNDSQNFSTQRNPLSLLCAD